MIKILIITNYHNYLFKIIKYNKFFNNKYNSFIKSSNIYKVIKLTYDKECNMNIKITVTNYFKIKIVLFN